MLKRMSAELAPAGDEIAIKGELVVDTTGGNPAFGFTIRPYNAIMELSARYQLTVPTLFLDKMADAVKRDEFVPLVLTGGFRAFGKHGIFNAVELFQQLALYADMARLEDLQAPDFRVVYSEIPVPALEFQRRLDEDHWDTVNIDTRADHIQNWMAYKSTLTELEIHIARCEEAQYQDN